MRLRPILPLIILALATPAGAQWTDEPIGRTAVVRLPTAPFPHASRPQYRDDRVLVFVPRGHEPGPVVDLVVHYHGHRAETVSSARLRRLREQLEASGKAAVLLCPQGPLRASDSAGGKHEEANGLKAFLEGALARLAQDGIVPAGARPGRVVLSGHSGAYRVIAKALQRGGVAVHEVWLHDAVYGELDAFEAFGARTAGDSDLRLVSTYTAAGGTLDNNVALRRRLGDRGLPVVTREAELAPGVRLAIFGTPDGHDDVTHARARLERIARTSGLPDVALARPRLLSVRRAAAGRVAVTWAAGHAAGRAGWRVLAADPRTWDTGALLAEVGPGERSATVPAASLVAVRVVAVDHQGRTGPPSDALAAGPGQRSRSVLVVDGFQRRTGRWSRPDQGFAATVAASVAAAGWPVDAARAEAVTSGQVDASGHAAIVWLAGDQGRPEQALDKAERDLLAARAAAGTALLLSGSELAWELSSGAGRAFLRACGVTFVADSAPARSVEGLGPFAGLAASFGGAGAPYAVPSPDVLAPAGAGARAALRYPDGRAAAVALEQAGRGRSLVVGFPLEAVDAGRDPLVARSLDWLLPPVTPPGGLVDHLPD